MTFPGTGWYMVSLPDPQVVCGQKKVGNHCFAG